MASFCLRGDFVQYSNEENIKFLNSPLTVLKGIGPKKAELFCKLNIFTVLDLLYYLPRGYEDRSVIKRISECSDGEYCCIKVIPVRQIIEKRLKQKLSLFLLYASDNDSKITIKWFSAPFSKPKINSRTEYVVYGRFIKGTSGNEFEMKCIEPADNMRYTGTVIPLYHSTNGLNSKTISDTIKLIYQNNPVLNECFPDDFLKNHNLTEINTAIHAMHHPVDYEDFEKFRHRLAFEELFVMQLALLRIKSMRKEKTANIIYAKEYVKEYALTLPFELTFGQKNAINDICRDLKSGKPMNRLIQGDVGCGKTAVAAAAMYAVCKCGFQSVFMAPTEILATQHYNTFKKLFDNKLKIVLLTSSTKNKKAVYDDIKNGHYDIVVGTHAILEDKTEFKNLSLAITDEQHRFGVNQRANLASKGENIHVLVMSATPIPRTLSLILYGDVDVSIIESMPSGRQKVDTFHIKSNIRERAYNFICKHVSMGKQAYVVCPLVEESESIDAASVKEIYNELKSTYLKDVKTDFLHGKMNSAQKEEVMKRFKNGETDVLISTTVIEVGVDVENATVMLIENAERFGLSQLHQLRGRVGRGCEKSYCILISDGSSEYTAQRMKIMTETSDGFKISEKDLELRGGGEFFGTRQHGLPELKVANLFSDIKILKDVQRSVQTILNTDPELMSAKWKFIKNRIDSLFENLENTNIFN